MIKRKIDVGIVVHCSATHEGKDIDASTIRRWHLERGFSDIGYHKVIKLDGTVEDGRSLERQGAHANFKKFGGENFNIGTIAICYVGGLDKHGKAKDTRTPEQKKAMAEEIKKLQAMIPGGDVPLYGHRDLSPDINGDGIIDKIDWRKECPCFDVSTL